MKTPDRNVETLGRECKWFRLCIHLSKRKFGIRRLSSDEGRIQVGLLTMVVVFGLF